MSEIPGRVRQAFRDHGSFEAVSEQRFASLTTAFDAHVDVDASDDGAIAFEVTVRVPTLDAVTEESVASVVEDGWFETFQLRVEDVGRVTRGNHDLTPVVERDADAAVVTVSFSDLDPRRGVDDANAFVQFVEGTYVQGIIPGYTYTEPVDQLLSRARSAGGDGTGQ